MPQPPYNEGLTEVAPRETVPDDYQHINAQPQAFGASIAKDVETAGEGLSTAVRFFGKVQVDDASTNAMTQMDNAVSKYRNAQGAERLNLQAETEQAVEQAYQQGRKGLTSPDQQLEYDNTVRNFRLRYVAGQMSTLGAEAAKTFATNTNKSGSNSRASLIAQDPYNEDTFKHAAGDMAMFARQQAHIEGLGPDAADQAANNAIAEAWSARIRSIGARNPTAAYDMAQKARGPLSVVENRTGLTYYDMLTRELEARKDQQVGNQIRTNAIQRTGTAVQGAIEQASAATGLPVSMLSTVANIESGGRPGPESNTGSYKGLFQLSAAEFAKYGGGDIYNPADNAMAAARKLKAEADAFQTQYGRPATPADIYLIHNQGAAGYASHMANPNAPAWQNMLSTGEGKQRGEQWAKAAIWGNVPDQYKAQFGSVENVTSRDFINLWQAKVMGATGPVGPTSLKSTAYQLAQADPSWQDASPLARDHALAGITRDLQTAEISENQTRQQRADAVTQSVATYTNQLWDMVRSSKPDYVSLENAIRADPVLQHDPRALDGLMERIEKQEALTFNYGPGFTAAREAIFSNPDAFGHMENANQFLAPDSGLTLAGIVNLNKDLAEARKDGSGRRFSFEKNLTTILRRVQPKFDFSAEVGNFKVKDAYGSDKYLAFEQRFNTEAHGIFAAAEKTGNWEKFDKYMSQDNIDHLMDEVYPLRERNMHRLAVGAEKPEEGTQAIPAAPQGINGPAWNDYMTNRPIAANGKPVNISNWSQLVTALRADPSEENIKTFDDIYKAGGFDAREIVKRLGPAAVAPPKPAEPAGPAIPPEHRENFDAANKALNLTPQEQSLYARHLTNLYGEGGVNNPDGSRSTLFQMSTEIDGRTYNLPTVYDGKILTPDAAIERAKKVGLDKFPSYGSEQEAEARYKQMHDYMEKDTARYFAQRPRRGIIAEPGWGVRAIQSLKKKEGSLPEFGTKHPNYIQPVAPSGPVPTAAPPLRYPATGP